MPKTRTIQSHIRLTKFRRSSDMKMFHIDNEVLVGKATVQVIALKSKQPSMNVVIS